MQITLAPVRDETPLVLERSGDTLVLNGDILDLSTIPEGAELPVEAVDSPYIAGPIRRENNVLFLTLALPHGADAPDETRYPAVLVLDEDGPVSLPPYEDATNV